VFVWYLQQKWFGKKSSDMYDYSENNKMSLPQPKARAYFAIELLLIGFQCLATESHVSERLNFKMLT